MKFSVGGGIQRGCGIGMTFEGQRGVGSGRSEDKESEGEKRIEE